MKNWWLYIKFLWHSTNQHGVHSPFVFLLVTKCFYNNKNLDFYKKLDPNRKDFKNAKLLYRFTNYFEFETIYHPENLSPNFRTALTFEHLTKEIIVYSKDIPKIKTFNESYLIYLNNHALEHLSEIENILNRCSNNSIVLIENIRQTPKIFKHWETLKHNPFVSVSIDTFDWGILCFRKEQHKEHFVIRI